MNSSIIYIRELRQAVNCYSTLQNRISLSLVANEIDRQDLLEILSLNKKLEKQLINLQSFIENLIKKEKICALCYNETNASTSCKECKKNHCDECFSKDGNAFCCYISICISCRTKGIKCSTCGD